MYIIIPYKQIKIPTISIYSRLLLHVVFLFFCSNGLVAAIVLSRLLDFSLTVKAATLIFISGCGSAISSAKEGKSGFIYNFVKSRANVRAVHENPNRIHTELTFINP